ncbi:MAG: CbtA family protein [Geminicoccaceae bacterium]|nr:CbtA family protein [Geminicoccaceae bacterium]MCB2055772.1 CbtA family protein [Geminicoccaceae bacterium]
MFRRIFASALIAALAAGIVTATLQACVTTPIIVEAERYEGGDHAAAAEGLLLLVHSSDAHGAPDGAQAWAPSDGFERSFYTATATLVTAFGWALLLVAAMSLRGGPIDMRRGLVWGACGFAAAALAPALGLPPELPGAMAADLGARQAWWLLAFLATAAGIWAMAGRTVWTAAGGVLLIILPHLLGAPHPERFGGAAPPELAAHFATASLAVAAVFWLVLGGVAGAVLARFDRMERPA